VVRSQAGHLEVCYDRAVAATPELARGELSAKLELTVAPDGRATQVAVRGLEAAPAMAECLLEQFRSLRYPTADGGSGPTRIVYPLRFHRGPSADGGPR
jgi:hypothetical protein